jgi:DNA-binding beta-propeller fold protein YncE
MKIVNRSMQVGVSLLAVAGVLGVGSPLNRKAVVLASEIQAPRFEVDPFWPKPLPNHWILGQAIGVSVDAKDHIWIVQRPGSLEPGERHATTTPQIAKCCAAAPPVLEFDQEGNLVGHWGGPGQGYDWPVSSHGITVDHKGNVWLCGNGRGAASGVGAIGGSDEASPGNARYNDAMILKFSPEGKFLMQIGKPNASKGSGDPDNLKGPAQVYVDPKTNEVYVADGYGNHRVVVYDGDTGKYKRRWGAYGNKPSDQELGRYDPKEPPAQQFRNPVHCVQMSVDNIVYVCDRANDRIQLFRPDGTFIKEVFIERKTLGSGSVWAIAFSKDPQQKYLYLTDGENDRIHILDRETMAVLTTFGEGGRQPGEFYGVDSIATDSKGNIYTAETYRGQRVQKFAYKGIWPVTKADQGVVWPKAAKSPL